MYKEKGLTKEMLRTCTQKLVNKIINTKQDVDASHLLDTLYSHKGVCQYTGVPLKFVNISIERIDPFKGYVRGNIALVSDTANKNKGHSLDVFVKNEDISLDIRIKIMEKTLKSMRKMKRDIDEKARVEALEIEEQSKLKSIEWLSKQMTTMTAAQLDEVVNALK